ncbi:AbrB family transcriptional regulator [Halomonas sp. C05BenzN]|uniref:AbrB family transcriptional regulator n=1 Tax=Halomonas sp. C05BenzN TaxID=3411041 RepID=UPI003B957E70
MPALTLLIAAAGVLGFTVLGLPLPWLLGSLTATLLAALLGWPHRPPPWLRQAAMVLLGIQVGSTIDATLLNRMVQWPLTVAGMLVLVALTTLVNTRYFERRAGLDRTTALFAAVPGAQSVVLLVCTRCGADAQQVLLGQISRIITVIYLVPLLVIHFGPVDGATTATARSGWALPGVAPATLTLVATAAGWWLARLGRLPQPLLLGPILGVGLIQVLQWPAMSPPDDSLLAVQFFLGASLGAYFVGMRVRDTLGMLGHGIVAMLITMLLAGAMTLAMALVTPHDTIALFLAFAPGGLTEIVLLAATLDVDPAFVVFHHLFRFIVIATLLPWLATRTTRR